jgi:hypothetical protein
MNLVKAILGLSLCAVTAGATPVSNSLTAGLFTFSNITVTGPGASDVTWSASTQSTSAYGGVSSITFSDNGATVPLVDGSSVLQFSYELSYTNVDPRYGYGTYDYLESVFGTPFFLGQTPQVGVYNDVWSAHSPSPSVYFIDGTAGEVTNTQLTPFDVSGSVILVSPSGSTPGSFTTTFAAIDSPEPSSLGFFAVGFGALLLVGWRGRRGFHGVLKDGGAEFGS